MTRPLARTARAQPRHRTVRPLVSVLTLLVLLGVWELVVDVSGVSERVVAAPSVIARTLVAQAPLLSGASLLTGYEGLVGFLISVVFGLGIGILLHLSATFAAAFSPLLSLAQMIPLITVAPLFIIWFGFEPVGKIVIVAVFSTFPIAVQTLRGLNAVPRFYSDVALTCGATRGWTLFHVQLRVAARQIFGGLKVSAAYVFATAATAEYLGARSGLGIVLQAAFNSFRTPLIFASTVVIVAMTGILLIAINACERAMLGQD